MRGWEGRKRERLGKTGKEPGFESFRAEVERGDVLGENPVECDACFLCAHFESVGRGVFHVEHQVDFVMGRFVRTEADLSHGEEWAGVEGEACFLEELPYECARGRLIELDVAARQIVIALGDVATEEHGAVRGATQKCARKELDLPIICHDAEPIPSWNVFHVTIGMGQGRQKTPEHGV